MQNIIFELARYARILDALRCVNRIAVDGRKQKMVNKNQNRETSVSLEVRERESGISFLIFFEQRKKSTERFEEKSFISTLVSDIYRVRHLIQFSLVDMIK